MNIDDIDSDSTSIVNETIIIPELKINTNTSSESNNFPKLLNGQGLFSTMYPSTKQEETMTQTKTDTAKRMISLRKNKSKR